MATKKVPTKPHIEIEQYPVIPLRDLIVFPHITKPIMVGRPMSYKALEMASATDRRLFLILQTQPAIEPNAEDLSDIGVVASIQNMTKMPDNTVKVLVVGLYIARVEHLEERGGAFFASVVKNAHGALNSAETVLYRQMIEKNLEEYVKSTDKISGEIYNTVKRQDFNPMALAYTLADSLSGRIDEFERVLDAETDALRIEKIVEIMQTEIEFLKLDDKIRQRVKHQMNKNQREYHLSEKMKAIHKELGKDDDFKADLEEIEQKIKDVPLPEQVKDKAEREMRKMKMMAPMSAESTVVRNYLDWLTGLPWGKYTDDNLDINNAEGVLNRDHYGLEKPKERILEYLSVRKLAQNLKGPIICFVGPPGVGKTSLARSIAESMGRKFVRISMGGVRDEAEIRGHRRTYIGSMPGKIIQSMRKADSVNPVFLLDEIDKMGSDYRGDPAAALLEALDPEQNKHFVDHYLEVEFDLSKVFFITTANNLDNVHSALMDRMEVIKISGYTEQEKYHIAVKYLIPKQLKEHSLDDGRVKIYDSAVFELIRYYTKEAGVRNLEREIASLIRKAARKLTKDEALKKVPIKAEDIEGYLGTRKFRMQGVYDDLEVGVATGLAWTPYGGDLLQIEVALYEGTGKLLVTGHLGDVMQESAKTAYSVVKSRASRFGVPAYKFKDFDIHLHVPEGAVPKDGPSAGITMATAIMSSVSEYAANCKTAMTGEITLRGKVLPVGGIKEKVLAAHRAGLKNIILPSENEKDLTELAEDVKHDISFKFVNSIDEVFATILNRSGVISVGC